METIKTRPLTELEVKIYERYAELLQERKEMMPEDFEGKAAIDGELNGIKFVVDLLSDTTLL